MNTDNIKWKKFRNVFFIWISICAIGFVRKTLQNDTFYTIKIGELILKNGIDMLDHFSFHTNLAYTYPHWLYDAFIYGIYHYFGFTGIYISSILLFIILLFLVFKTITKLSKNYLMGAFSTFICALAISGYITARAQLISFILFVLEIYFIESFLNNGKKRNLVGLVLISLALCNVHTAVWPFYFVLYLPYLAEYLITIICNKLKIKENRFTKFIKKRIILEKNENIKLLFITMLFSILTGLITPIGNTPYTYLYKTMIGHSQQYIKEHQMLTWANSPFTIIIAFEIYFLAMFSKIKLRDLFMVSGLVIMAITSVRHIALLALIGSICFGRTFDSFLTNYEINIKDKILSIISKKWIVASLFAVTLVAVSLLFKMQIKTHYVDEKLYPVDAVKYIKENLNFDNDRLYNEYDYGSYLLFNDIPVFIDSRADLYTKQFSGLEYDIFDDFEMMLSKYPEKFNFYKINYVLLRKEDNVFYQILKNNPNYTEVYDDKYFVILKRNSSKEFMVTIKN